MLFSRVLSDLAADGMRPALRLRSLDRDATLTALHEGELDLAVGFLPRARRWHERRCSTRRDISACSTRICCSSPAPVPIEAFATGGHIVPSLRGAGALSKHLMNILQKCDNRFYVK